VGYQGTTGNSTGIHLHWGYYKKPRDRSNGYNGFINQEGLYDPWGETMANELEVCLKDRQKFWDERDSLLRELQADTVEGGISSIRGLRSRITDLTKQLGTAQAEVKNKDEIIDTLNKTLLMMGDDINTLTDRLDQAQNTIVQLGKDKGHLAIEVEQLKIQVETLKQQNTEGKVTLTIGDLFKLIWNQKITISK
jgi:hypothetical protein